MTSIHKFDRALATLRQKLAQRPATGAAAGDVANAGQASQASAGERTMQMQRRIRDRLAPLDLHDRTGQERGATIFLETVLGNEFGAELLDDPAFYDLIADVRKTMLDDDETQKDLVAMLMALKDSD